MKRLMAGTLAVVASLAITASAHAAPKQFWFNCTGAAPLQTIDVDTYSWSDTAPTEGIQDGAGCGFLDPGALQGTNQPNPLYDAGFGGAYKGEIRKIEMTVYGVTTPVTRKTSDIIIRADGEDVFTGMVEPTVTAGPNEGISAYTFTFPATAVNVAKSTDDKEIVFAVAQHWSDSGTPGWLFGSSDVPSNVKLYGWDDLTPEEQQEILCNEDETLCDDGEE